MSLLTNLIGLGMAPEQASALDGYTVSSAPNLTATAAITAAGTAITDATALTTFVNVVGTTASGTGVKLPDVPVGQLVFVQNNGANALNLWPHSSSGTLNGGTAGAAVTIAAAAGNICVRASSTNWLVYALAKEA